MTAPRVPAWSNPTWVIAVMHYPDDELMHRAAAGGAAPVTVRRDSEREFQKRAVRKGKVAGNVLAALYTLDASPWRIEEPGLARAVHVAERMAYEDRHPGAPRGHTKIQACYDAMRPVAHLWAGFRLHWEFPVLPHDQLMRTPEGIRTLLGIALGIQQWALMWKPVRSRRATPLLGPDPWLIPDDIPAMLLPWSQRPAWLLKAANSYKRKNR